MRMNDAPSRFSVLRIRDFRLLWLGQLTSAVGDRMMELGAVFFALELTGRAGAVGVVMAAMFVPRVLLTVLGGVWADRVPRRSVMLVADLVRAAVQLLIAAMALTSVLTFAQFSALAALYATASAFFAPACGGVLPEIVPAEQLGQANALLKLGRSSLALAGPGVGGLLVAVSGTGWLFAADAVTFCVSAALVSGMRITTRGGAASGGFGAALRTGFREITSHPWLSGMIVYFGLWNFAIAPMFVLGPYVAHRWLGGQQAWAAIMTASTAGVIVGSLVALRHRPARAPLRSILLLMLLPGGHCAALAMVAPTPVLMATMATTMGALTYSSTCWATLLQRTIATDKLSRVSAYDYLGGFATLPLGYVAAGPLTALLGVATALWLVTVALSALTGGMLLLSRGSRFRIDSPATTAPI